MDKKSNEANKPKEDQKAEQPNENEIEYYGLLSAKKLPLSRWQGRTSSIIQLPGDNGGYWVYFQLADPIHYENLNIQSQNRSETVFFNADSKKLLRVADDCLTWSYYTQGPFQRLESGVWLPINPTPKGSQPETFVVEGLNEESYVYDNGTGLIIKEILPDKKIYAEAKWKGSDIELNQASPLDLEEVKKTKKINPENEKKNKNAWKEAEEIMEKLNKQKDMKAFREAVMKGEQHETLEIKGSYITEAFEELMGIYDCNFEFLRSGEAGFASTKVALNGMNDAKFVMGVIMPEICLYPRELLKQMKLKSIQFCGKLMLGETELGFMTFPEEWQICLNCSQRNIIKIQQNIHQAIFKFLYEIGITLPNVDEAWRSLNPPDFEYHPNRKKILKGIKGFITFRATQHFGYDMQEIYFALIKNPPTILNHSDIIIAKKGHLIKNVLNALYPDNITEEWWTYITNYKDIIELSAGSTEHFKEAQFKEEELQAK